MSVRGIRIISVMVLCVASGAEAQTAKFNLRCEGTMTSSSSFTGSETKPYSKLYRVDLDAGKWCENDCPAIFDIASVQPTQITFQDQKDDGPTEQSFLSEFVERTTGEHYIFSGLRLPMLTTSTKYEGHCEREDFDGFPAHETKF